MISDYKDIYGKIKNTMLNSFKFEYFGVKMDLCPSVHLREMQFCYFACSASWRRGPKLLMPFWCLRNKSCVQNEFWNYKSLHSTSLLSDLWCSLNFSYASSLDLLQPIPSLWLLTKCITSQVQPTARYTAVALRTVFQKSCCKRLSPILVPYRRSASSRTRDTHLSGNKILSYT